MKRVYGAPSIPLPRGFLAITLIIAMVSVWSPTSSGGCVQDTLRRLLNRSRPSEVARPGYAPVSERVQLDMWQMEGRSAQRVRGQVADSLRTAPLTRIEKMMDGANLPDLVRIEGTELRGIMKSYRIGDRNVGAGEVAASNVDDLLGVEAVPLTIERMNGSERVTVQLFVPNQGRWGGANPREFTYFDDLVGQLDRNRQNYLNSNGRLIRIDNEQAFTESRTVSTFENLVRATNEPAQLRSILPTREVDQALRRVSENSWRQALSSLQPRQIEAFLERRRDLIRVLDEVRARYGDGVFRSGRGIVRSE